MLSKIPEPIRSEITPFVHNCMLVSAAFIKESPGMPRHRFLGSGLITSAFLDLLIHYNVITQTADERLYIPLERTGTEVVDDA